MRIEKTFSCDTQGILGAQAFLETVSVSPKTAVVLDEVVSNIVRCSGASDFTVGFEQKEADFIMTFVDGGRAFDPTNEVATPNVSADADERQIGGLGVFMVKKMSKAMSYRRQDGKNVLTVIM